MRHALRLDSKVKLLPCVATRVSSAAGPLLEREYTSTSLPAGELVLMKSLPRRRLAPSTSSWAKAGAPMPLAATATATINRRAA